MQDPSMDFGEVFFAICKNVNTPFSLACWLQWKYKVYASASQPQPRHYDSAHAFGLDYLCYSWPSKARCNLDGRDLESCALDSFIADEEFNSDTARKLKNGAAAGFTPRVEALLHNVKRKISAVLGDFDLRKMLDDCRFGNGATATLSRRHARYDKKITTLPFSVTRPALALGKLVIESDPAWLRAILPRGQELVGPCSLLPCCFEVVEGNLFDTVPKSLKTNRTIAKEPVLNGFLQQGVHCYIRERLKRVGVDLTDQTLNQAAAGLAQKLGWSTLDLKSASNSVTDALIALLLPHPWYEYLNLIRSRKTQLPDGTWHTNHMFSSMGNAFTFELESLIFWAISAVICGSSSEVFVYGDDIIVPERFAHDVVTGLETFGFRINTDKSFIGGRFFESCGKHYYDGSDVTPCYQKANPLESVEERLRAHNRLIRWAGRSGLGVVLDSTVRSACELLARGLDSRLMGPIGPERDDFLQVPHCQYSSLHGVIRVRVLKADLIRRRTRQAGAYAYWLRLRAQPAPAKETTPEVETPLWKRTWLHELRRDAQTALSQDGREPLELSWFSITKSNEGEVARVKSRIASQAVQVGLTW